MIAFEDVMFQLPSAAMSPGYHGGVPKVHLESNKLFFFCNCFGHSVLVQHYRGTNTFLFSFSKLDVMLCGVRGSVGYVWVYVCTYAPVHVHVYLWVGNNRLCTLASALCFCMQ